MINKILYLFLFFSLISCSNKRESDVDFGFNPGIRNQTSELLLVANSSSETTYKNVPLSKTLQYTSSNNSQPFFSLVQIPSNGSVVINSMTGVYEYTPNLNYVGNDFFIWKVTKGNLSSIATVNIVVLDQNNNQAPTTSGLNFTTNKNQSYSGNLIGNDPENDPLDYSLTTQEMNGSVVINQNTGSFVYTPNNNFIGNDSFTYRVNDGQLNSNISTVIVNVIDTQNQPPQATNLVFNINEDQVLNNNLNSTDPNNDSLSYLVVSNPTNGTVSVNSSTGLFTYTPNSNYNGVDTFTYKANDGQLDSNVATVNINISPVNDPPIANSQNIIVNKNSSNKLITLTGNDVDGDQLSFILVQQTSNGLLSGTGNNLTYTPNTNFVGTDSFTFKVNDGQLDSNIATVLITINNNSCNPNPPNYLAGERVSNGDFEADVITGNWDLLSPITGWSASWSSSSACELQEKDNAWVEIQSYPNQQLPNSNQYVELDTDCDNGSNKKMTNIILKQEIDAKEGEKLLFSFYYKARRLDKVDNKLKVKFGKQNFYFNKFEDTNWKHFEMLLDVRKQDVVNGKLLLHFEDNGKADTYGIFIDNVSVSNPSCEQTTACSAVSDIISYSPMGNIALNRKDPNKAKGQPDGEPYSENDIQFVSLGLGGEIVVKLDNPIYNKNGNDFRVWEVTGNNTPYDQYKEKAEIYASFDNLNWTYLGIVKNDNNHPEYGEVDLGQLNKAQYIKLKDISESSGDGFDLDAITCLNQ